MKIDYILSATGNAIMPRIDHIFHSNDELYVKRQAETICLALSKAGYFSFNLYNVSACTHFHVATFTVEQPEPIIFVK